MARENPDSLSDEALVEICNTGDAAAATAAFASLYRRHRGYVLKIALRFTRDRELAADALQDAFTYLLRQFPPPGPGLRLTARLSTYLYPIAKNSTLTLLRRDRRTETGGPEPDELPDPGAPTEGGDDLDRLLASLPAERREILSLRFVDDLSLEDIAAVLGIPLGTVKSRLHLAIKALREHPAAMNFFGA
jgi:RNA polymerase sigma-70 factor (ECF subfamily)